MAAHGYDDERFKNVVSKGFHCTICRNVFKDPVQCRRNQHLFCRGCITKHLANQKTCPLCKDELTYETLCDPPRSFTVCLGELEIRCCFFERGCSEFVELQNLERHAEKCGYAPTKCSNEDCHREVNRRDLIHHECLDCETRKVKCHNCDRLSKDVDELKGTLTAMNKKVSGLEKKLITSHKSIFAVITEKLESFEKNLNSETENQQKNIDDIRTTLKNHNQLIDDGVFKIVEEIEKLHKKARLQTDDQYATDSSDEDKAVADIYSSSYASSQD